MSLFDLPSDGPEPKERKTPPGGRSRRASPTGGSGGGAPPPSGPQPLGVGELTERISGQLKGMGRLAVEGEISALKRAGSGHLYFNLKDSRASLSCAIWRSRVAQAVRFDLQDGQQVVCHGRLDVYAPRGNYSLIVERVEPRGLGEMLARLERLKKELAQLGWFDRCRPLPAQPRKIGLVTSRDADALRDFLRTRSLRWPGYPVRLCHTRVQGPGAAQEIARAIERLDDGGVDVICVVRGGGSIEDLWAFNERVVAEAVQRCSVPVISGVGHETDTTLIDWVADHRAHTPTNAAEQAIPDRRAWLERLERAEAYLESAILRHLRTREQAWQRLAARPSLRSPDGLLRRPLEALRHLDRRMQAAAHAALAERMRRLDACEVRLSRSSPQARLAALSARMQAVGPRMARAMQQRCDRAQARLDSQDRVLKAISPLAVLGRGYSLVERLDERGQVQGVVRSSQQVFPGDDVRITLGQGRAVARVGEIEEGAAEPKDGAQ